MKKILILSLVVALAVVFSLPLEADASCNVYGKVVQMRNYTTGRYIYVVPFTTVAYGTPYAYYFIVYDTDPSLLSASDNSYGTGKTVYVSGNASVCGGGDYRYGGVATYIQNYRDY